MDALFNGSETIEVFYHEVPFAIKGLGPLLGDAILNAGGSAWAADLVQDGIVAGVGAVCNFIPQLIILFFCLALLETTGYMPLPNKRPQTHWESQPPPPSCPEESKPDLGW